MAEVLEGIAALLDFMGKDGKCEYKADQESWKANLNGSSTALATNLGNKPQADSESNLSKTNWPSQAHHLIPHLTLLRHPVAKWLKEDTILFADTKYNVDHKNNGKWMPYASSLKEWTSSTPSQKKALMFKVMSLAGIQLHQGPHSSKNRYGIGIAPYKQRVIEYLDKIKNNALSHYVGPPECNDCKGKKQSGKYPPRNNTVRYVDKASELIEKDINKCLIFVSRIAAEFAEAGGFS